MGVLGLGFLLLALVLLLGESGERCDSAGDCSGRKLFLAVG